MPWKKSLRRFLLTSALLALVPCPAAPGQERLALADPLHVRWSYETPRTLNLTPAAQDESLYVPLSTGTIVSLRASDGALNWTADMGGDISSHPVADATGVYVASAAEPAAPGAAPRSTGALRFLGRQTGVTNWMRTLHAPVRGGIAQSDASLFFGASDGHLYAVSKTSGEIQWVRLHSSAVYSQPRLDAGGLFLGDEAGNLLSIDPASGRTLWRYQTRGAVRAAAAFDGPLVFAGSADGYVYALDRRDGGLRWRVRTGAGVQSVVQTVRGLLVTSLDNFVYCLSYRTGRKLWKRQLPGRVSAQPLASGDSALFAPLAGDECVVLGLEDGKKLNSLPVGEDSNMAAAPILAADLLLITTRQGLFAFSKNEAGRR